MSCNQRHNKDIILSKTLSKLLRHRALEDGLQMTSEGFVPITQILQHRFIRGKYFLEDIQRVVTCNDKQRFCIKETNNDLEIRANQGHSIPIVENLELQPILSITDCSGDIIHGTYYKNWNRIKEIGLSPMERLHIHFARGLPGDNNVISGMRSSAQIYIYINLKKALDDKIPFYRSTNDVVLSPGNANGIIEYKYFLKVIDSKTGKEIFAQ